MSREMDWGAVSKRLTVYAYHRLARFGLATPELAQDMAFEALRRMFDDAYASPHDGSPGSMILALGSLVNGLVNNHRRKLSTQRESTHDLSEASMTRRLRDERESPEEQVTRRQYTERVLDALRVRVAEDPLGAAIVEGCLRGVDEPAAQAAELGVSVREIYNANRRLKKHYAAVRAEFEEARGPGTMFAQQGARR